MGPKRERNVGEVIALTVKKLREFRHLTQVQLAEKSGVSQTMISAIERCTTSPGADTLQAIAKALGVEVWQLQIEGIDKDLLYSETLPQLVYIYRDLAPPDRQALDAIAKRLARSPS